MQPGAETGTGVGGWEGGVEGESAAHVVSRREREREREREEEGEDDLTCTIQAGSSS